MKKCCALFAIAILFGSCNILFMPKKQTVELVTGKKEATVYLNDVSSGTGEVVKDKILKDGLYSIIVKTPGYRDHHSVLIPTHRPQGYLLLQFLDLPFVILGNPNKSYDWNRAYDRSTNVSEQVLLPKKRNDSEKYLSMSTVFYHVSPIGYGYKYYPYNYKFSELKDLNALMEKNEKEMDIADEKAEKERAEKEKKEPKKKTLDEKEKRAAKDVIIENSFVKKTLFESGYSDTINEVFKDNNNSLILEAKIFKASFHDFGMKYVSRRFGTVKASITWYIKNSYGQVLDSVKYEQQSEQFIKIPQGQPYFEKHLSSVVDLTFLKLLETPQYKKLAKIEKEFNANLPKTELNAPKQIVEGKETAGEATVIIKTKSGHGSGFAITNDGYILTNYHVVCDRLKSFADDIKIITSTGEELEAKGIAFNAYTDVALLKVDKAMPRAFKLSNTKSFKNLQTVFTIGAPKSIELGQSVSSGVISNEREVNNLSLLQLNISINSGNSGGPVFESNGGLHGVIVSKLIGKNTEGIAFAIPAYLVPSYLNITFK